jgi:ribokinase
VVVVGSINHDLTASVDRLPHPGETILGSGHRTDAGGKGANQAVAAARLGRRVAMVGRVGDDELGRSLVDGLERAGVDTMHVGVDEEAGTGLALITVDRLGENTIVVSPGANGRLSDTDVAVAADLLTAAPVTLLQLEVPIEAVVAAIAASGGTVILNPAPARPLPPGMLDHVDVLVPNETELARLTGGDAPRRPDEVAALAAMLRGPASVVVTMGSAGAVVAAGGDAEVVPAPRVTAVDPTAAGDAFCAALADALVGGFELVDAVRWAVAAGAVTVTREGAQAALPSPAEVEALAGVPPPGAAS